MFISNKLQKAISTCSRIINQPPSLRNDDGRMLFSKATRGYKDVGGDILAQWRTGHVLFTIYQDTTILDAPSVAH